MQVTLKNNGVGSVLVGWTPILPAGAKKVAIRKVTPITPANELGYEQINAVTNATQGQFNVIGLTSGVQVSIYAVAQNEHNVDIEGSSPVNIVPQ